MLQVGESGSRWEGDSIGAGAIKADTETLCDRPAIALGTELILLMLPLVNVPWFCSVAFGRVALSCMRSTTVTSCETLFT